MMNIKVGKPVCFSEIGQKDNQEDSLYPAPESFRRHPDLPLFLVCDGVGGLEKGEVASSTVCAAFSDYFIHHSLPQSIEETELVFREALAYAYDQLDSKDEALQSGPKMGTTLTFSFITGNNCLAAHLGDSRIYWIRPTDAAPVRFRSNDHSLVNYLVAQGEITPEEALYHPKRNVILKAMQPHLPQRHEAEIHQLSGLQPGDYLFLCSDGVLEKLSDEALCRILQSGQTNEEKMEEIRNICQGSYDNYTAILIPIVSASPVKGEEIAAKETTATNEPAREMPTVEASDSESPETNKSSWFKKLFQF